MAGKLDDPITDEKIDPTARRAAAALADQLAAVLRDSAAGDERAARLGACEAEVWAALAPILERYGCRLVTVQQWINGVPGEAQIKVAIAD